MASARRSSRPPVSAAAPPGCISGARRAWMLSTSSTARDLPSISRPAFSPRISSGQASRPAVSSVPPTLCAMDSFRRARFKMHSRSTADCTCWKSASPDSADSGVRLRGRIMPTSRASSLSSTPISVAAISTSSECSGCSVPETIFSSRSVSPCTAARSSPRPSTPSVSPILCSISTCGARLCGWPEPRRTKISSTSLTLPRSSRMAAATVCMSLTLGAERLSRSWSTASSTGSSSFRRNEARTAVTRGPLDSARPT